MQKDFSVEPQGDGHIVISRGENKSVMDNELAIRVGMLMVSAGSRQAMVSLPATAFEELGAHITKLGGALVAIRRLPDNGDIGEAKGIASEGLDGMLELGLKEIAEQEMGLKPITDPDLAPDTRAAMRSIIGREAPLPIPFNGDGILMEVDTDDLPAETPAAQPGPHTVERDDV